MGGYFRFAVNNKVPVVSIIYFGDMTTDGSYRQYISGDDLVTERLESSNWTEKSRVTANP
jgi:hypothetical protein